MVNPGHPSYGCKTCRLRRIKCDLTKPACLKCTKSRRPCLGYDRQAVGRLTHRYRTPDAANVGTNHDLISHKAPVGSIFSYADELLALPEQVMENVKVPALNNGGFPAYLKNPASLLLLVPQNQAKAFQTGALPDLLGVVGEGLAYLREPLQTVAARTAHISIYSTAISNLRMTIETNPNASALPPLIFLLSFYEMIVCSELPDKSWQVHLDGLLAIIGKMSLRNRSSPVPIIHVIVNRQEEAPLQAQDVPEVSQEWQTGVIIETAKLDLYSLARRLEALFTGDERRPRKLEVQKLRVGIKRVQLNIALVPPMLRSGSAKEQDINILDTHNSSPPDVPTQSVVRLMEYWSLVIVTTSLLLRTDAYLQPAVSCRNPREKNTLRKNVEKAALEIFKNAQFALGELPPINDHQAHLERPVYHAERGTLTCLSLLWPLACISIAPCISEAQCDMARDMLAKIGLHAAIPQASSLAMEGQQPALRYLDVLAGLILLGFIMI